MQNIHNATASAISHANTLKHHASNAMESAISHANTLKHHASNAAHSALNAARDPVRTGKHMYKTARNNRQFIYDIIIGILVVMLIILVFIFTFDGTMSLTRKNITVNKDLTVNGTLTAKTFTAETNVASISTTGGITCGGKLITTGGITCGGQLITTGGEIALVQNGSSNYGLSTFSTGGLYFGVNMTNKYDEMDIIAVNSYMGTNGNSTSPILNIYTSNTEVVSEGAATTSLPATSPIVSISESDVIINGNCTINGTLSIDSAYIVPYFNCSGFGIFSSSGAVAVTCSGSGVLAVGGAVTANGVVLTSDYRLKEEIEPISDEYSIDKLKPCSYLLKDDESKTLQTGFIAHEIQEIFPHLVNGEKDGEAMQAVNYIGLIAILTKELQSLKADNIELKTDIIELKAANIALNSKIESIIGHI